MTREYLFDYGRVLNDSDSYSTHWTSIYDDRLSLPQNFLNIIEDSVYLPQDFYRIVCAYAFIPSVLAKTVPYLFLNGVSGSGKSTLGKLIAHLHGVKLNTSGDTFASIRNSLEERRHGYVRVPSDNPAFPNGFFKKVEVNTILIWDDIDPSVFSSSGDLYRLFKFGYDKSSDKIEISSLEHGKNLVFHCFCPKVFSSISPLHLDDRFLELRRRLLVIPCKKIEDL